MASPVSDQKRRILGHAGAATHLDADPGMGRGGGLQGSARLDGELHGSCSVGLVADVGVLLVRFHGRFAGRGGILRLQGGPTLSTEEHIPGRIQSE